MNSWTAKTPKTVGYYWFYGDPFTEIGGKDPPKNKIYFVEIVKGSNSLAYITSGSFIYPHTFYTGYWMLVDLPRLPKE